MGLTVTANSYRNPMDMFGDSTEHLRNVDVPHREFRPTGGPQAFLSSWTSCAGWHATQSRLCWLAVAESAVASMFGVAFLISSSCAYDAGSLCACFVSLPVGAMAHRCLASAGDAQVKGGREGVGRRCTPCPWVGHGPPPFGGGLRIRGGGLRHRLRRGGRRCGGGSFPSGPWSA